jgi:small-conductance mechanosensitive channel
VLDDPAPMILFVGFGESSLDFEVRVYVESFMDWLAVRDELTTRIDDEFREAGIEIPFPQRDLHVRSSDIALPIHTQAGPDLPDKSDLVDR